MNHAAKLFDQLNCQSSAYQTIKQLHCLSLHHVKPLFSAAAPAAGFISEGLCTANNAVLLRPHTTGRNTCLQASFRND
jgi:hypothetical protein